MERQEEARRADMARADSLLAAAQVTRTVFRTSFCKSQFPLKSANLFFILLTMKDKLTDLRGN